MPLKRKKDGSFVIVSRSHVREALDLLDAWDSEIKEIREESGLDKLEQERAKLKALVDAWVIEHDSYEDDTIRVTRVQGYMRKWNVAKLEKLVPRGIFKNITKTEVNADKVDEYVKAGRLSLDLITPAYEETPKAAYAKWTPKSEDKTERAKGEAESLSAKLK